MTPFLLAFLASLSVAAKPATPAKPKQEPLVLDGARSFVVTGRGASVELTGDVRFHRGDVKFRSDRAVWDRAQDVVRFEGAFQLTHPSGSIVSQTGRYERSSGSAWAEGDAVLADSSGDITITAGIIRYDRTARIAEARREPVFRRRSTSDSTKGWDTIEIKAERLQYREDDSVAEARGNVRILRGELSATCGVAVLDRRKRQLSLQEAPKASLSKRRLSGKTMVLDLDLAREEVKRVAVYKEAVGLLEGDPDSAGLVTTSRVLGDTLFAEVDGSKLRELLVTRKARGETWTSKDSARIDRLDGDSLRLSFRAGRIDTAWVRGNAKSFYHWLDQGRMKGVNEAQGRIIRIAFNDGRIRRIRVEGTAKGVYNGTEPSKPRN
jgi:hypothetical protein